MSEQGPSWWRTRVYSPAASQQVSKTWFFLFEFFQRHAESFAVLRVSVSDGNIAADATFSHGETFSQHGYGSTSLESRQKSQHFRDTVDDIDSGSVTVTNNNSKSTSIVVEVHGSKLILPIALPMKNDLNPKLFLERSMIYMTHMEASLESEKEHISELGRRRAELLREVQTAVEAKKDDDDLMARGMCALMNEKRKYWRQP